LAPIPLVGSAGDTLRRMITRAMIPKTESTPCKIEPDISLTKG